MTQGARPGAHYRGALRNAHYMEVDRIAYRVAKKSVKQLRAKNPIMVLLYATQHAKKNYGITYPK